jgi:hypothetical protein
MIVLVKGESIGPFHLVSAPPNIEGHGYPGGGAFKNAISKGCYYAEPSKTHGGLGKQQVFYKIPIISFRGESKNSSIGPKNVKKTKGVENYKAT